MPDPNIMEYSLFNAFSDEDRVTRNGETIAASLCRKVEELIQAVNVILPASRSAAERPMLTYGMANRLDPYQKKQTNLGV